jgi:large subunit ribosomal protein L14
MLFPKSFLKVVDNSGAKYARCLKVLKTASSYGKKSYASVGDLVLVSIRFCIPRKQVKKGEVYTGLVVRTKCLVKRSYGDLYLMQNAIILLDKKMQPLGTRMFGPVGREVRVKKYNKLSTIAKFIV